MKRLIQSFLVLSISQTLAKVSGFVLLAILARKISVSEYGTISLIISIASVMLVVSDFGIDVYTVKELSQNKYKDKDVFLEAHSLRLIITFMALIISFTFSILFFEKSKEITYALLLVLAAALSSYSKFLRQPFYVSSRAEYDALSIFSEKTSLFIIGFLLIYLGFGIEGYVTASLIASTIAALISIFLLKTKSNFDLDISLGSHLVTFFKACYPIGLNAVFVVLYLRLGAFFIENYRSADELGWFGVISITIFGFMTVTSSLTQILFPTISRVVKKETDVDSIILYFSFLMLFLVVPVLYIFSLNTGLFIQLIFGDKYQPSAQILSFLVFQVVFLLITPIFGSILRASDRAKSMTYATAMGLTINFSLCLMTVEDYGIDGIAWSCLITEAAVFICACFLVLGWAGSSLILTACCATFSVALIGSGNFMEYEIYFYLFLLAVWSGLLLKLFSGFESFNLFLKDSQEQFGHS